jgi:hypothetical protein
MHAAPGSLHSVAAGSRLSVEEIVVGPGIPDPTKPEMRSQVLASLGLNPGVSINRMARCGGQNEGVWLLEAGPISYVLKLVRNVNLGIELPTETEKFVKLAAEFPGMLVDEDMTFPIKIFTLKSPVTNPSFDIIVMRKASGERLSDVVSILWARLKKAAVMSIMEKAGRFLKEFHSRYGHRQHCDFQPSNLFYDEATGKFTMVDLADMNQQAYINKKDIDHFLEGLRIMGKSLGPEFMDTQIHFQAGYNSAR